MLICVHWKSESPSNPLDPKNQLSSMERGEGAVILFKEKVKLKKHINSLDITKHTAIRHQQNRVLVECKNIWIPNASKIQNYFVHALLNFSICKCTSLLFHILKKIVTNYNHTIFKKHALIFFCFKLLLLLQSPRSQ